MDLSDFLLFALVMAAPLALTLWLMPHINAGRGG